ncbi:MAG: class I SAM-dependent methyltransferase [Pseudomonadota bacterium]
MKDEQIELWDGPLGDIWATKQQDYDRIFRDLDSGLYAHADIKHGMKILDVGCGCGTTALYAASSVGSGGQVTGIDVSTAMLKLARARAAAASASIQFIQADAATYSFEKAGFDLIVSRLGVMFFADPQAAFKNLHNSLKKHGSLCFLCFRSVEENSWASEPLRIALPFLKSLEVIDPDQPGPFAFANADRLKKILQASEFRDIAVIPFNPTIYLGDDAVKAAEEVMRFGQLARVMRVQQTDKSTKGEIKKQLVSYYETQKSAPEIEHEAACWIVKANG